VIQVVFQKRIEVGRSISVFSQLQTPQKILGINSVAEVGDEAHIGLVDARKVQDNRLDSPEYRRKTDPARGYAWPRNLQLWARYRPGDCAGVSAGS